ncbi:hypothetical protein [Planctobacterium marinum]|uniref:Uncharacterized protein n=1 Tax=Planctobacterium marinum TaxID=1631968 RepID=A0AA48KVD4_9ALTE|nr:hypothetical protein MACH26_29210 [Planctobacterium marinum]
MSAQKKPEKVTHISRNSNFRGAQSYMSGVSDSNHEKVAEARHQQEMEIGAVQEKLLILINELEELLDENN